MRLNTHILMVGSAIYFGVFLLCLKFAVLLSVYWTAFVSEVLFMLKFSFTNGA